MPSRSIPHGRTDAVDLPDLVILGAPKAGTTALHDALARHPQLFASPVKEPKYFLTPDRRPDPREHRGPGDAHSAREWVWRRKSYERLFREAPRDAVRFESTPFYLWYRDGHERLAATLPDARFIAVIRDPVDRAYSNWMHLYADGLEPEGDFVAACHAEDERAAKGWAPFWRYLGLGRYGEQLESLFRYVDRERVHIVRYREVVDTPGQTLDGICEFLGVQPGIVTALPDSNLGRWAPPNPTNNALRAVVRAGAALGALSHPRVWRTAERPLRAVLQRGSGPRPRLQPEQRTQLVGSFADDIARLERLLGRGYSDWLSETGKGTYTVRRS